MTLLICRTCPRYDHRNTGKFSRDLTAAITADGRDLPIRKVQCLGGCPDDGVAAVDGPGMTRVRFTGLTSQDAPAIISAALAHQASITGDPADWDIPPELTGRISSITSKRQSVTSSYAPHRSRPGGPWATRSRQGFRPPGLPMPRPVTVPQPRTQPPGTQPASGLT